MYRTGIFQAKTGTLNSIYNCGGKSMDFWSVIGKYIIGINNQCNYRQFTFIVMSVFSLVIVSTNTIWCVKKGCASFQLKLLFIGVFLLKERQSVRKMA